MQMEEFEMDSNVDVNDDEVAGEGPAKDVETCSPGDTLQKQVQLQALLNDSDRLREAQEELEDLA